jgi:predicted  nucleic acid-binding Zn-ribbon protein
LLEEGFKEDLIQLHEVVGLAFQMGLKKGQTENIGKQQDLLRAAEQCGRQQLTMELGLDDPEFQALFSLFTELKSKIKSLESDLEDLRYPSYHDPCPNCER